MRRTGALAFESPMLSGKNLQENLFVAEHGKL